MDSWTGCRGPGLQTMDLLHDISNRKIIHLIQKIAGHWIIAKTPLYFSKIMFESL
jgi:hypothetical protein